VAAPIWPINMKELPATYASVPEICAWPVHAAEYLRTRLPSRLQQTKLMRGCGAAFYKVVRSVERRQFTGTFLFGNRPQFELMRHLSARKSDPSVRGHPC